jgi:hypothetical protein
MRIQNIANLGPIVHLYNFKCMGGWSNLFFSSLLEFINELFPTKGTLNKNTYKVKKYLRELGLGYEKILTCRNDCMLFWRDNNKLDNYTMCEKSRWKDETNDEKGSSRISKRRLVKVLWWFLLISRL